MSVQPEIKVREAKGLTEFSLAKDSKGNQKVSCTDLNGKRKIREYVGVLRK